MNLPSTAGTPPRPALGTLISTGYPPTQHHCPAIAGFVQRWNDACLTNAAFSVVMAPLMLMSQRAAADTLMCLATVTPVD